MKKVSKNTSKFFAFQNWTCLLNRGCILQGKLLFYYQQNTKEHAMFLRLGKALASFLTDPSWTSSLKRDWAAVMQRVTVLRHSLQDSPCASQRAWLTRKPKPPLKKQENKFSRLNLRREKRERERETRIEKVEEEDRVITRSSKWRRTLADALEWRGLQ